MWFNMFLNIKEKTKAPCIGLYVSAGAILSLFFFLTHFIAKFSKKKNKHRHNTTLSRPTSTITSEKPAQIHPFLSESGGAGNGCLNLNFRQVSHRFTRDFTNTDKKNSKMIAILCEKLF